MPDAFLIDLDGTLIDSEPWYKRTEVECLNNFGVPIVLEEMEEYTGLTLHRWLDRIHEKFGIKIPVDDFVESYRPQMEHHAKHNIQLFPDAENFLKQVADSPSIIVTSSLKWYVDAIFESHPLIPELTRGLVCESDVKIGKPDPEPYLIAASRLNVSPERTWVIEDAYNGVKSGVAAGCHTIGIDRQGLGNLNHAHRVITSLTELENLVNA